MTHFSSDILLSFPNLIDLNSRESSPLALLYSFKGASTKSFHHALQVLAVQTGDGGKENLHQKSFSENFELSSKKL